MLTFLVALWTVVILLVALRVLILALSPTGF